MLKLLEKIDGHTKQDPNVTTARMASNNAADMDDPARCIHLASNTK